MRLLLLGLSLGLVVQSLLSGNDPQRDFECGERSVTMGTSVIKSHNYPDQYPHPFECTWKIGPTPRKLTRLSIDDFKTDPEWDSLKLEESHQINGMEYKIPIAYLAGSLTSEDLAFNQFHEGSTLLIGFHGNTTRQNRYRFHFSLTEIVTSRNPCKEPFIFLSLTKPLDTVTIDFNESLGLECPKLVIAPKGKTIQIELMESDNMTNYFAGDLDNFEQKKEMPNCKRRYTNATYRSFTNEILVKHCNGRVKLRVSLKFGHCSNIHSDITMANGNLTQTFGTPNFEYEHYEFCEKINYTAKVYDKTKANETHFFVFSLQWNAKRLYPVTFKLNIPTFNDQDKAELLSFNSSQSGSITFPANDFDVRLFKGAIQINLTAHLLPMDCHIFHNKIPMIDVDGDKEPVHFVLPKHCGPMDFWMKIKNRPGKTLSISTSSSTRTDFHDQVQYHLIINGQVAKSFFAWEQFSTGDLTLTMTADTNIYVHVHVLEAKQITIQKQSEQLEMNFGFEWDNECNCSHQYVELTNETVWLSSPNFPYNYCNNLFCRHRITAPKGSQIRLEVSTFELDTDYDEVYCVYGNLKKSYTKLNESSIVISETNEMDIVFATDRSDVGKGFLLKLTPYYDRKPNFLALAILFGSIIVGVVLLRVWLKFKSKLMDYRLFARLRNDEEESLENTDEQPLFDLNDDGDL